MPDEKLTPQSPTATTDDDAALEDADLDDVSGGRYDPAPSGPTPIPYPNT